MPYDNPAFELSIEKEEPSTAHGAEIARRPTLASQEPVEDTHNSKKKLKCRIRWTLVANIPILLILLFLGVLFEFDFIPFQRLGFQCGDQNLSYKFKGDTIHTILLTVATVITPFAIILTIEAFIANPATNYTTHPRKDLKYSWLWCGQYLLGLLILVVIIQLCKSIIGEPRPHFFETCKPTKVNCTKGYVAEYKCTNKEYSGSVIRDSYKSFPSGHSALGIYLAVFISSYLQIRVPRSGLIVVIFMQCLLFCWAALCGLTRIIDRRHHWWDVLAGFVLGFFIGIFTVKYVCHSFSNWYDQTLTTGDNLNEKEQSWKSKLLPSTSGNTDRKA